MYIVKMDIILILLIEYVQNVMIHVKHVMVEVMETV